MNGWLEFENYCYKSVEEYQTWYEANDSCIKLDANLASIHSEEENNFIISIMNYYYNWIGLHWDDNEFKYTDRSEYDYSNWGAGEPSQNGACVYMDHHTSDKWYVITCNCRHYVNYVCKKPNY